MIKLILVLFLFFSPFLNGQSKILFAGNISGFCFDLDSLEVVVSADLPDSISTFDAIFMFSSANSILDEKDVDQLLLFLQSGKGLYLGSENWPLQSESNQVTKVLFAKETWGYFTTETADISPKSMLNETDSMAAGSTTVAFPLDYRLKVEAWVDDEPLISSGKLSGGRIIIDGGYSRFYCTSMDDENQSVLVQFINYLANP